MSMQIRFSRHARRRAKLYALPEDELRKRLELSPLPGGRHEITISIPSITLPVRLIVDINSDIITVISNYPLKKGRGQ